jgi:D-aminopeptidase
VPRPPVGEPPPGTGSIIVIVGTDAPLLPNQCDRVAQRAALGIGRTGGAGENSSDYLILCFSTGNRGILADLWPGRDPVRDPIGLRMVPHHALDPLFYATIEATEEAIANALLQAETMTGRDGLTVYGLDPARLAEVMIRYGRRTPTGRDG